MRSLQTKDIFIISRLIVSLNSKEGLKNITSEVDKNSDINPVGYEAFFTILGKCTDENSKKKIYEFLSGLLGIKTEEVGTVDPLDLLEKLMEIVSVDK